MHRAGCVRYSRGCVCVCVFKSDVFCVRVCVLVRACSVYSDILVGTKISTFEDSKPNDKVRPCSPLPDILKGIALFESS